MEFDVLSSALQLPDSFLMETKNSPPVCDYEGSDYQRSFWDQGGREYEDRTEAIALKRLLPKSGQLMLELGAGAGRKWRGSDPPSVPPFQRTKMGGDFLSQ